MRRCNLFYGFCFVVKCRIIDQYINLSKFSNCFFDDFFAGGFFTYISRQQ